MKSLEHKFGLTGARAHERLNVHVLLYREYYVRRKDICCLLDMPELIPLSLYSKIVNPIRFKLR